MPIRPGSAGSAADAALSLAWSMMSQAALHAEVVQEQVGPKSVLNGVPLHEAGLPPGCVIVSVQRGDDQVPATGQTVLTTSDLVTALTTPDTVEYLHRQLRGTHQPPDLTIQPMP